MAETVTKYLGYCAPPEVTLVHDDETRGHHAICLKCNKFKDTCKGVYLGTGEDKGTLTCYE